MTAVLIGIGLLISCLASSAGQIGAIESDSNSVVSGWAWDPAVPDEPVSLLICLKSITNPGFSHWRMVDTGIRRDDLRKNGICLGKHAGFLFELSGLDGVTYEYQVFAGSQNGKDQSLIGEGLVVSGHGTPLIENFGVGGSRLKSVPVWPTDLNVRMKQDSGIMAKSKGEHSGGRGQLVGRRDDSGSAVVLRTYSESISPGEHIVQAFVANDGTSGELERIGSPQRLWAGSEGNDRLIFPSGSYWVECFAGDDEVTGSMEMDYISLGPGNDHVFGGNGDDRLDGGEGRDGITGGGGDDECAGGLGNDVLGGGPGNDSFFYRLGDGHDHIIDPEGRNRLVLVQLEPSDIVSDERNLGLRVIRIEKDGVVGSIKINDFGRLEAFRLVFE